MEIMEDVGRGEAVEEAQEKVLRKYTRFTGRNYKKERGEIPKDAINIKTKTDGRYGPGEYVSYEIWEYEKRQNLEWDGHGLY